jgi:pentatricopeptide repeat protein
MNHYFNPLFHGFHPQLNHPDPRGPQGPRCLSEVITCNAVISACGKAGRWQMAWEVLQAAGTTRVSQGEQRTNGILDCGGLWWNIRI